MSRSSLKIAISSPYQCDVTVTAAGKFLQIGVYVRSYMCSSSTGLMGECDSSNSNDLYYNPGSYSQATLMSQLSSVYEVTFSSSVFSYDSAEVMGCNVEEYLQGVFVVAFLVCACFCCCCQAHNYVKEYL